MAARGERRRRIEQGRRARRSDPVSQESRPGVFRPCELFDTYIAIDPSLWWNDGKFLAAAPARVAALGTAGKTLWLAAAEKDGNAREAQALAAQLKAAAPAALRWNFAPFAAESHLTIYHPAALRAFREVLAPRR